MAGWLDCWAGKAPARPDHCAQGCCLAVGSLGGLPGGAMSSAPCVCGSSPGKTAVQLACTVASFPWPRVPAWRPRAVPTFSPRCPASCSASGPWRRRPRARRAAGRPSGLAMPTSCRRWRSAGTRPSARVALAFAAWACTAAACHVTLAAASTCRNATPAWRGWPTDAHCGSAWLGGGREPGPWRTCRTEQPGALQPPGAQLPSVPAASAQLHPPAS